MLVQKKEMLNSAYGSMVDAECGIERKERLQIYFFEKILDVFSDWAWESTMDDCMDQKKIDLYSFERTKDLIKSYYKLKEEAEEVRCPYAD